MKKGRAAIGVMFVVAVAAIWLLSARPDSPRVAVSDVRRAETLMLGKETGDPYTHGLTIRGSGEIDGDATIALLFGGQPYKVAKLSGKVHFVWGGDWYSETAEVRYVPGEVRSGKVVLHYRFAH